MARGRSALGPTREEVGSRLARGWSNAEIALEVDITERTVKHHVSKLLQQHDCASRRQLVAKLGQQRAGSAEVEGLRDRLTSHRLREVYNLLIAGASNAQIADGLGISLRTVKYHMTALMTELGLKSTTRVIAKHWASTRNDISVLATAEDTIASLLAQARAERDSIDRMIDALQKASLAIEMETQPQRRSKK